MTNWNIKITPVFRKQYRNMGHDRQRAVDNALREIITSENPAALGRYKRGGQVFAYELSKGDRLLYNIDYNNHKITLVRVGDHKSAYGSD